MTRRVAVCLLGVLALAGCRETDELEPDERAAYQNLLLSHHERYPRSRAEDFYKLISQSVFGVGHLIEDEASARSYLEREILTLGDAGPGEPLVEPLDPEGRTVRVHLRPFVARGLPLDSLLAAMLETAAVVKPDTALFLGRWEAFRDLVDRGEVGIPMEDFEAVDAYARERNYPALHHSDAYRGAYKPAYRVVLGEILKRRVELEDPDR